MLDLEIYKENDQFGNAEIHFHCRANHTISTTTGSTHSASAT